VDGALSDDTQELPVARRAAGRSLLAEATADRDQNRRALEVVLHWAEQRLSRVQRQELADVVKANAARRRPA
jgi:hypothetical protein